MSNLDEKTIASFGDEWTRFDQSGMTRAEAGKTFEEYFSVFPWSDLPTNAIGFDMGCGSGRWASFVAPRVGFLHCIDPSSALQVAQRTLAGHANVEFHRNSVDTPGLPHCSQDFGYSLGVLHHVPDTLSAIRSCVSLLKPGAPFLVYLYYDFDGRPPWFKRLWRVSDLARRLICRMSPLLKHGTTNAIALFVYFPLSRFARLLECFGVNVSSFPLSYYRGHSFYTLCTDSRDRFGTPLERRFSRAEIEDMLHNSGLVNITFSPNAPFWCAVGYKSEALNKCAA